MLRKLNTFTISVFALIATPIAQAQTTAVPPNAAYTQNASPTDNRYAENQPSATIQSQRPTAATLPEWPDGKSVYLSMNEQRDEPQEPKPVPPPAQANLANPQADGVTPPVVQASFAAPSDQGGVPATEPQSSPSIAASPDHDQRRLAPPSMRDGSPSLSSGNATSASKLISKVGLPADSIYTTLSALVIVVGLFLVCMWTLRRGSRRSAKMLPAEVVSVLGRVPLAGRQFAELLRVGNKLVLVALMPTGAETLTEVTDPVEVDRLAGLCQQHEPHSTTLAFEDVFKQLSDAPTGNGFLDQESPVGGLTSAAAVYRMQRGGARG